MTHYYSPHTLEHIATSTPAAWMASTPLAPPTFNAATQSCLYQDGAWVVSDVLPHVPPVPEVVSMRQARIALLAAGHLSAVTTAVASMPGIEGDVARIEWEYAQEVRRDSPLLAALAPALGMTGAQVDALFVAAAAL